MVSVLLFTANANPSTYWGFLLAFNWIFFVIRNNNLSVENFSILLTMHNGSTTDETLTKVGVGGIKVLEGKLFRFMVEISFQLGKIPQQKNPGKYEKRKQKMKIAKWIFTQSVNWMEKRENCVLSIVVVNWAPHGRQTSLLQFFSSFCEFGNVSLARRRRFFLWLTSLEPSGNEKNLNVNFLKSIQFSNIVTSYNLHRKKVVEIL